MRGDESRVFVAGPTRFVVFDKGVGERRAETDGTVDDQFEAPWTGFEETSTICTVVH